VFRVADGARCGVRTGAVVLARSGLIRAAAE
jgi:hypothetical protein